MVKAPDHDADFEALLDRMIDELAASPARCALCHRDFDGLSAALEHVVAIHCYEIQQIRREHLVN
jgi:hypothetical protein